MFGCGEGLVQLGFDFSSLEARVEGHYILPFEGGEELAEALLAVKPNDVHSITARKLGIDRSDAKAITYAIMYGAAAAKLKKMLGLTDDEAEKMWADFWDSVAPLKALRDKLTAFWEATEKAYIPGIDGRKIRVRSQHSLINALFQSSGAILAKWSVVRVAEKLEKLGLLGDPFLHTKEDVKVWQMIVYHDECQYALHKSLIKVKSFFDPQKQTEYEEAMKAWEASVVAWNESGAEGKEPKEPKNPFEEEAEQWMKDNPIDGLYSAIGHTDSGLHYVTLPNIVSETILESIDKTVNEHDIRVPLGIEWITGKNWYMCH
jgi:DNA polymerase I-like protein with 3'-5' exonuclease and polymerase domains